MGKVKNAISKRRPRQNIIALILKNAKRHGSGPGSAATKSTATTSTSSSGRSRSGVGGGGGNSDRVSNHYHGSKRGILQSAVELTRRSKRASGRSRGKRNTFVKGQKAFYRSAKGIAKVTVCGIHHDSKLEPYYTIQLRDGKEKQTDGKHLTPIQEDVKGSSSSKRKTEKSSSKDDKKSDKKKDGKSKSSKGSEEVKSKGGDGSGGKDRKRGSSLARKQQPGESEDEVIDFSDECEVESEDEVIDFSDECEDEDEVAAQERGEKAGGAAVADQGSNNDDEASGSGSSSYSNEDQDNTSAKKFVVGKDAYFRSADGAIAKIRIVSKGDDPRHPNRYTISFSDGSQQENVKPSDLATLLDLTIKEVSSLMKEKNKRQHNNHNMRPSLNKSSANGIIKDATTINNTADKSSASGTKDRELKASTNTDKTTIDDCSGSENSSAKEPIASKPSPPPIQTVEMVEARTEDGGTKLVPLYPAGMTVQYKNVKGVQSAEILQVHMDDLLEPYYSIRLADGREKQTDNAHIMLLSNSDDVVQDQGSDEGKEEESKGGDMSEDGMEDEELPQEDGKAHHGEVKQVGDPGGGKHRHEEAKTELNPRVEEADKTNSSSESSKKQHQEEVKQAEDHVADADSTKKPYPTNIDIPSEAFDSTKKEDHNVASVVTSAHFYLVDDEVLYTSSQGEHMRAVVVRLLHDKKNRPYYLIQLATRKDKPGFYSGNEKQVYGHRLRPYVRGGGSGRSRSRSRGPSSRSGKDRGRSSNGRSRSSVRDQHSSGRRPRRSDSIDSYASMESNVSRKSRRSSVRRSDSRTYSRSGSVDSYRSQRSTVSNSSRTRQSSRAEPHDGDDVSNDAEERHARRNEAVATSRERRLRSLSETPHDRKHNPSRNSRHGDSLRQSGTERRAASEESRSSSHRHHHRSSLSRSTRRTTPTVSSSSVYHTPKEGEDESSPIAKLRSFRKSFTGMRKQKEKEKHLMPEDM